MFRRALRRFAHNRTAFTALIIVVLLALCCWIIPLIGFDDYASLHLDQQYAPVSLMHPFSTDHLGRDMFSRIFFGGRYTLGLSFLAAFVSLAIGVPLGMSAGYFGGWFDQIVSRLSESLSAVPYVLIAIIMEVSLGWGKGYFALAVAISNTPAVVRNIRAAVLRVRNEQFIAASRLAGKSDLHIIFRHVLRNVYSAVLVQACTCYGASIVSCSILGYLEIGISSPTPEWGRMVADYFHLIQVRPFLVALPCLFVSLSVLCVTLVAQGLRDALDPKEYQHE